VWDNIVPTVGFGIGFIGLLLAVYFYKKSNPKRKIESYIEYVTSLVKIGDEVKSDIEINYKGEAIENINKIRLIMNNTGNKEIKNDNVIKPIIISVPDNKIIDFNADTPSKHFEPDLILDVDKPSVLQITPNYMEKGDTLTIEILSIGPKPKPLIEGVLGPPRYECSIGYPPFKTSKKLLLPYLIMAIALLSTVILATLRYFNLINAGQARLISSIIAGIAGPIAGLSIGYLLWQSKIGLFRHKYPR